MQASTETENDNYSDATEAVLPTGQSQTPLKPEEFGGPKGKEPTRYGDWEKNGRCIDF